MPRLKLIWLKTGPLHPLDTGGKIRTHQMLRELHRRHDVTFLSLCPPGYDPASLEAASGYSSRQVWIPWTETPRRSARFLADLARNLVSPLPYVIAKYHSPAMTAALRQLEEELRPDLVVCDFVTPAVNLGPVQPGRPPVLLFQHNVETMIWRRLRDNSRGLRRAYLGLQARRMQRFERAACQRSAGVVAVSEDDAATFRTEFGLANVLGAVPTGVDTHYYTPPSTPRPPGSLVFLGSMDWMPNIDGATWFVTEVLPLIRQRHPAVTLTIVGRRPTAAVNALATQHPGITVTGTVPDVRPFLAQAELLVVPLRVGGGTRIKIYEGMATGLPVVSTRIGAEGLPLVDGETIALADAPADFARRVSDLLADAAGRQALGDRGLDFVRTHCGWDRITDTFEQFGRTLLPSSA